ncbi:16S rRNA (uracil(1498)-N(3))-methyltransferase [Algibacillus agarilyticus]|uniref:16S rRNA (uracil(1498)-N(3))-methyltransferase n=1 Tax=Algibacillus agarilyticus TaxID=2234133 RepID=UPI000DD08EF7|nr:16S rRNA (uracil(1498)-N(3))-methyltransferase [Algibacillus agarilyticus]
MRIPRIYHPETLTNGQTAQLTSDAANHVARVMRMKEEQLLILFNGDGHDYTATIMEASRKKVEVLITQVTPLQNESPLAFHLGQVISRGDRMDFTIQKSVELGVTEITPLFSERCGVKLNGERLEKRIDQWQKIAIGACEQSGRAIIPTINPAVDLETWLDMEFNGTRLNLHPLAQQNMRQLTLKNNAVQLLIGPEGGLSDEEISAAETAHFEHVLMGPRVLRTETAGLAAISMLQCLYGDL